jgi:tRNA-2-methylthio-N6-dimethylallyladenosine synthase
MIERMAHLPKVCEHLNIPVQAGDNALLTRMKRGYTVEEYCERIDRVRELWPNITLSTDVIVGFCGETEEEFQHTLDLLQRVRFDVVHVAAYSVRPGTVAARWEDDVPLEEKKRRLHRVEEVQVAIGLEINQAYVGNVEEVMLEEINTMHGNQRWKGRTRSNKWVFFPQPDLELSHRFSELKAGDLVHVCIEQATAWSLQGSATAV